MRPLVVHAVFCHVWWHAVLSDLLSLGPLCCALLECEEAMADVNLPPVPMPACR